MYRRPHRYRRTPALAGGYVPPLPHPSWADGGASRQEARAIGPDEFWRKLGL